MTADSRMRRSLKASLNLLQQINANSLLFCAMTHDMRNEMVVVLTNGLTILSETHTKDTK